MPLNKPETIKAAQARRDMLRRLTEVETQRDQTIDRVTADVTLTIKRVQQLVAVMTDAPSGTFTADEQAFPVAILDDLSASVDTLSASLKAAIADAKGA